MTLESINKTDIDLRENLLSNILVAGGNSLLPGFIERYEKCLFQIAPQTARIKVYSSPKNFERSFASWIGGSVLGSTGCFQNMWISRREYEEVGPSIIKRKCGGF
jgi:actin-related protein